MRQEHTEANQLLDVFATRDRTAAKRALEDLQARVDERTYQRAVYLANQQYQMYERDHRLHTWRADWLSEQKRARAEHGKDTSDVGTAGAAGAGADRGGQGTGDPVVTGG